MTALALLEIEVAMIVLGSAADARAIWPLRTI